MKAVTYERFGGPEVLVLRDLPDPEPGSGEVGVEVRAASINPADGKFRRGELKFLSGRRFPKRVGGDFAGVVTAVGAGVTHVQPGDEVFGLMAGIGGGAYAERVVTAASLIVPKPPSISFEEAASAPVVALAAWSGLHTVGRVRRGQSVLINGASGGMGVFAVQIAAQMGAQVTATATGEGLTLVRELGAHRVIDYRRDDIRRGAERYDVIFELSGRMRFAELKARLEPRGVFVNPTPTPWSIVGSTLANPFRTRKHGILMSKPSREALEWIGERLADGRLRPVVAERFDLEQVQEAIRFAERGGVRGKVVLRVGASRNAHPSARRHSA